MTKAALIYGGHIVLNTSNGDGLDSNGSIVMAGGTVITHGLSREPEVMIDYNGTFNISDGFLISSGSSSHMLQGPSASSAQNSPKRTFRSSNSANTIFHIEDTEGNDVVTFQPAHSYQSIVFPSSGLVTGQTYSAYPGGTSTGTNTDGLYSGGSYTGGAKTASFNVSGKVTSISN